MRRVDHRFNDKTNFFGRYSFNDIKTIQPTGFPDVNGVNPGGLVCVCRTERNARAKHSTQSRAHDSPEPVV